MLTPTLQARIFFGGLSAGLCALLLLGGCAGSDSESAGAGADGAAQAALSQAAADVLVDSWMYAVVADPALLAAFEKGRSGEGWLAFFNNDLDGSRAGFGPSCTPSDAPLPARADAGFPCVGLARTHLELARFFAETSHVDRVALRQFYSHRETHPEEVLPSVHQGYFQGITLVQSGAVEAGTELLSAYSGLAVADPMLAALASRIVAGLSSGDKLVQRVWGSTDGAHVEGDFSALPSSAAASAYRARLNFIAAVAGGDAAGALALIRPIPSFDADLREELPQREGATGVSPVLFHHDPAFLVAMSRLHALQALEALGGSADLAVLRVAAERLLGRQSAAVDSVPGLPDGLSLVLFSTTANPADLGAAQRNEKGASAMLSRLSASFPALGNVPTTDLSDLDPFVDMSNTVRAALGELIKSAAPHGASMDADMGLSERFRGGLLLERARQYQDQFAVRLEVELARDAASAGIAARSLLELVLDKNPSPPNAQLKRARISFRNNPTLLASLARAQLDTRQSYEANDYIRPLSGVYAELVPVREALAALDSAWNPARRGSVR
jgi:hypothetical protein